MLKPHATVPPCGHMARSRAVRVIQIADGGSISRWFPSRGTHPGASRCSSWLRRPVLPPSPCCPSPGKRLRRSALSLGGLALACVPKSAGQSELETSGELGRGPSPWLCPQDSGGPCSCCRVLSQNSLGLLCSHHFSQDLCAGGDDLHPDMSSRVRPGCCFPSPS